MQQLRQSRHIPRIPKLDRMSSGEYMSGFTARSLADLHSASLACNSSVPSIEVDIASPPPPALRVHKKYNSVTLPVSVLHSVTGASPNRPPQLSFVQPRRQSTDTSMARPRSPMKRHHSNHESDRDRTSESQLDQTLLAIREKLSLLSTERVHMEHQMDSLTSGIREASVQCRKLSSRSSSSSITGSSIRRVRSIGEAEAYGVSPRTPKRISLPRDEADGVLSDDAWSIRSRSSTSTSRESFKDSPILTRSQLENSFTSDSLASSLSQSSVFTSSLSSSLPHITQKEMSGYSVPLRDRSSSASSAKVNRVSTANLDLFIDDWFSAAIIPELPESPRSLTPSKPCFTTRDLTPSPFKYNRQISTPELSDRRKFYTSPRLSKPRGSLPQEFTNKVINSSNDSLENTSTENLSQVSPSVDQGSPSRTGSTMIIRRSSLTGQLEHVRRPKVIVKRNSSFNTSTSRSYTPDPCLPSSNSFGSICNSPRSTRGRSKSPRPIKHTRQHSVILPSIETCV